MKALISVLFGTRDRRVGWVSEEELPQLPAIGMPVVINVGGEEIETLEGQVYRTWSTENNEPGGMLIYGGPSIPDEAFQMGIETAGWERLTDDALSALSEAVEQTPALAATHEVLLIIGNPLTNINVYHRALNPYDPALPLFSQRLRLEIARDIPEGEAEEQRQEEREEDELTVDEWFQIREKEIALINSELKGEIPVDGVKEGVPAVTIYSTMVKTGVGRVAFWVPNLGNLTPVDLLANGWKELSIPEEFNAEEFRVTERVSLALQTTVTFEPTNFGTARIKDWSMESPLEVTANQYNLLPQMLVEHVKAAEDFSQFDDFLDKWEKEN